MYQVVSDAAVQRVAGIKSTGDEYLDNMHVDLK